MKKGKKPSKKDKVKKGLGQFSMHMLFFGFYPIFHPTKTYLPLFDV
jgi:hypothetical protein